MTKKIKDHDPRPDGEKNWGYDQKKKDQKPAEKNIWGYDQNIERSRPQTCGLTYILTIKLTYLI